MLTIGWMLFSPSGQAVPLTDSETMVETADYNETTPLISGDWLVWSDDNGEGQQSSVNRIWARDLSVGPGSDTVLARNFSRSVKPTLEAPWVAWASKQPTGGDIIFVRNLETSDTFTPLEKVPSKMVISNARLYYQFYNGQTFFNEVWEHDLVGDEGRAVLAPSEFFPSWDVYHPHFVWSNYSVEGSQVWLGDLTKDDGWTEVVRSGPGSDIMALAVNGQWVAWYNETHLTLTSQDGAISRLLATFSGYKPDGDSDSAGNLDIDARFLTWDHKVLNFTTTHEYVNGTIYDIEAGEVQPLLPVAEAKGSNQSYLKLDQERFIWRDDRAATTDIWWLAVANLPPVATIEYISPSSAVQGTTISFSGLGEDSDGSVVAYLWEFDLVGSPISSASSFTSSSLPVGTHTISFTVQDDDGDWSVADTGSLVISTASANEAPTAYISSISPNPAKPGELVSFVGGGTDTDGSIVFYSWYSSLDGELSFTAEFSLDDLSEGTHYLSFIVEDDDGAFSEAVESVLVVGNATKVPKPAKSWLFFSYPEEDGEKVEEKTKIIIYSESTEENYDKLELIRSIRLLLVSNSLGDKTLFDTESSGSDKLHGESLFALNMSAEDFEMLKSMLKDGYVSYFFPVEGTLYSGELPNGYYTLRVEARGHQGNVIFYAERDIVVENPRIEAAPAVVGTAVGVVAGGAAGAVLGGAGAAAGSGGGSGTVQADGVGSKLRRKKKLQGGLFGESFSIVLALVGMVLAYAYASLAQPTLDPAANLDQFNTILLSDIGGFLSDLGHMVFFLGLVMAIVIIFRAGVDHMSAKAQGVRSVFKLQAPGAMALGLSTALFGMPFGYPAQSLHEKKAGYELREARIAMSQVMGTLILVLPFWFIWQFVEVARFMAEIGLTVVLMSAFSIAIPLKHSEGRSIYRWKKEVSLGLVVVLVLFFYGWQLDFLPTAMLPLVGIAGIVAMPNLLKPAPKGPTAFDDDDLEDGTGRLPEAPRGREPTDEHEAFRPPDREQPKPGGWGDTVPGAPGEAPPGKGWGDTPLTEPVEDGPPSEPLPDAPPLPDEPLPEVPLPGPVPTPVPEPDVARRPERALEPRPEPDEAEEAEDEGPVERQATACKNCGKAIDTNWKLCPYCSTKQ